MKKYLPLLTVLVLLTATVQAQTEPAAGNWKTWFISSGKEYRLAAPVSYQKEITQVISIQKHLTPEALQQIAYWNAGAPGYRWRNMMMGVWTMDTSVTGVLANMLLSTGIYDATVAAWDTKYAFKRPRPYDASKQIIALGPKAESPSYPCEYSVAAGVAVTIFSKFYPQLKDSVMHMAQRLMDARIASGLAFPTDVADGFALGKRIAEKEIEHTKDHVYRTPWDRKIPEGANRWRGKYAMFPMAGHNKTVILDSASEFRPGPPPDFTKDMAEMKAYKQTPRTMYNALFYANSPFWDEVLNKKIFEYNLQCNAPRAARIYAIMDIAYYDGFAACWDAKYTYWGIRPSQYDTTYKPLLSPPPFPGYPSGHAALSSTNAELLAYFFPGDAAWFRQKAKDVAESRFQAGIHFRTDNDVALILGKQVADKIIERVKKDGIDGPRTMVHGPQTVAKR